MVHSILYIFRLAFTVLNSTGLFIKNTEIIHLSSLLRRPAQLSEYHNTAIARDGWTGVEELLVILQLTPLSFYTR